MNKCYVEGCESLNTKQRTRSPSREEVENGLARSEKSRFPAFYEAWFCKKHFEAAAFLFPQVSDSSYGVS